MAVSGFGVLALLCLMAWLGLIADRYIFSGDRQEHYLDRSKSVRMQIWLRMLPVAGLALLAVQILQWLKVI
jgi:hypothetical protein